MTTSTLKIDDESLQIESVSFDAYYFHFHLKDGRILTAPLWWYPRLLKATVKQRNAWEVLPFGDGIEWNEIDEHISAKGVLLGKAAPGAVAPVMDAAE
jgi:hypothetical protein